MHPRAGAQGALACDAEPVVKLRQCPFAVYSRPRQARHDGELVQDRHRAVTVQHDSNSNKY